MTGWFGNRKSGRDGRGRGRGGPTQTKTKKTVEDFFFYVGSSKQASDYEITAEFVVDHIKKTFDRGNDNTQYDQEGLRRPIRILVSGELQSRQVRIDQKQPKLTEVPGQRSVSKNDC
jgi:hypothetical protein